MIKLPLFLSLVFLWACASGPEKKAQELPYQETWESLSQFPQSPEFFLDSKFGIYTHWGPVTVGSDHPDARDGVQWYGQHLYNPASDAWELHRDRFGDQNEIGYKDIAKMFRGEKFDADEWAEAFKSSGARFAGPVAIHHDNYAMWDSEVTPWNSADQSPKKDFTGELARAIKSRDMLFFVSFHHSYTWDYFYNSYKFDAGDGLNKALYCEPHGKLDPPSKDFLDNWLGMVDEVVYKYEPDMIWFDFGLGKLIPDEYQIRMFANYYNWAASKDKDAVVFHKHEKIQRYTGVLDFERGRANKQTEFPWLTDTSIGPWFHQPSYKYYTPNQLIDILIDIISKNGCMLLNVGPRADGSIPEDAKDILSEMGDWLKINGEAVFETRPWTVFGEGPTRMEKSGGFSESKTFGYSSQDIRFTRSKDGKSLYAFVLDWPEGDEFTLSSFNLENGVSPAAIAGIQLLGSSEQIVYKQSPGNLQIRLPDVKPCQHAYCFKIDLK